MEGLSPHHFGGIDWASDSHVLCILDPAGQVCASFPIAHTAEGLDELVRRLDRFGPRSQLPLAIERPSGLLVDFLQRAGFPVVPIHPNVLKASRPRYSAAQGKSDPTDAYIAADLLRTDGHRFHVLAAPSDSTAALRAAVRAREDLVHMRVKLANQLRALLESFWPGPIALFAEIDSAISLAFLEAYPTPQSAARLGEKRMASFLRAHGYSGRKSAAELLRRLHAAPEGCAGPQQSQCKGQLVRSQVTVLRCLLAQIRDCEHLLAEQLAQHPDGALVQSFPRTGCVNAAQILAELGEDRKRFASFEHLAGEAGVAPVTSQSGKRRGVYYRNACNKRLRTAVTTWADNSRHASAWAASIYKAARARGCDHPHAVRILARAWLRVLWRCWADATPYDPQRHVRALPFLSPTPVLDAA